MDKISQQPTRLYWDAVDIDSAIAATNGVKTYPYTPDRDHTASEMRLSLYDSNYAPFVANPTSSGNTAQGAAVPSLHSIRIEIFEAGNNVTAKPIIAALLASTDSNQRVFPREFKFVQGVDYRFKIYNYGPIQVAGGQIAFVVDRHPSRS